MRPNQPRDPLGVTRKSARTRLPGEEPILAELFSVERLEEHARTLAVAQQTTTTHRRGRDVHRRIDENGKVLSESYRLLARAIRDERSVTPAAEWLVDNFPIVDEQLREIRDDLPTDYYRALPKLVHGPLAGYPRVLGLTWAYIAHTDSRFDPESLRRMVLAYQEVEPLTIGELWAIAITLRILLVENLRRQAEQIVQRREARQLADEFADSILSADDEASALAQRRLSRTALSTAARVQLFQRLRDLDPTLTPALRWLEDTVIRQGTTAEELVRVEHQRQATMNVTVRNVITSMRLVSWFDWSDFVESIGKVDDVLRAHSSFAAMDFTTRNQYREAIEVLSRESGLTEVDVARRAVRVAESSTEVDGVAASWNARRRDPGYYLISEGRPAFERTLGGRVPIVERIRRLFVSAAGVGYLLTIIAVAALTLAVPLLLSWLGEATTSGTIAVTLLALVPASEIAIALVNRLVTRVLRPRPLPRLDLHDGVPTEPAPSSSVTRAASQSRVASSVASAASRTSCARDHSRVSGESSSSSQR